MPVSMLPRWPTLSPEAFFYVSLSNQYFPFERVSVLWLYSMLRLGFYFVESSGVICFNAVNAFQDQLLHSFFAVYIPDNNFITLLMCFVDEVLGEKSFMDLQVTDVLSEQVKAV